MLNHRIPVSRFALLSLLFLASLSTTALRADFDCNNLNAAKQDDLGNGPSLERPVRRYPDGVDAKAKPNSNLQAGFESEYAMSEIAPLLEVYGPSPQLGVSKAQWLQMSQGDRSAWVTGHLKELFPNGPGKTGLLTKINDEAGWEFMPKELVRDETGNVEIVLPPIQTLEQWYKITTAINKRFGPGSMQATVSIPTDVFFARGTPKFGKQIQEENRGFLRFMNEYDAMDKLQSGAEKFATNPKKASMLSFLHQWLGPINRARQRKAEEALEQNMNGQGYDPAVLAAIKGNDASLKYIGSTSYRPDLAVKTHAVFEVRDAHKSFNKILERVYRLSFGLLHGRARFTGASKMNAFDTVAHFDAMPAPVKAMLQRLFPSKANPAMEYSAEERVALEVFRNFSYPLKDWNGHLEFLKRADLAGRVQNAQKNYNDRLQTIAAELSANKMTAEEASASVQGALATFAPESGLFEAMDAWYKINVLKSPEWNRLESSLPRQMWLENQKPNRG